MANQTNIAQAQPSRNPMKNVMELFRAGGTPQQIQQPAQPAQPQVINQDPTHNATPTSDPVPSPIPTVEASPDPASPLVGLSELFNITHVDPNNPEPNKPKPMFDLNEDKLMEKVNTMNFVSQAQMESLQERLQQGDTTAMAELINMAARAAYAESVKSAALVAEHSANYSMEHSTSQVPNLLQGALTQQELATQNKLFTDPAIKPMADQIAQQYRNKYPQATPQDIARYTQHYFKTVAEQFNQSSSAPNPASDPLVAAQDFSSFFN